MSDSCIGSACAYEKHTCFVASMVVALLTIFFKLMLNTRVHKPLQRTCIYKDEHFLSRSYLHHFASDYLGFRRRHKSSWKQYTVARFVICKYVLSVFKLYTHLEYFTHAFH